MPARKIWSVTREDAFAETNGTGGTPKAIVLATELLTVQVLELAAPVSAEQGLNAATTAPPPIDSAPTDSPIHATMGIPRFNRAGTCSSATRTRSCIDCPAQSRLHRRKFGRCANDCGVLLQGVRMRR